MKNLIFLSRSYALEVLALSGLSINIKTALIYIKKELKLKDNYDAFIVNALKLSRLCKNTAKKIAVLSKHIFFLLKANEQKDLEKIAKNQVLNTLALFSIDLKNIKLQERKINNLLDFKSYISYNILKNSPSSFKILRSYHELFLLKLELKRLKNHLESENSEAKLLEKLNYLLEINEKDLKRAKKDLEDEETKKGLLFLHNDDKRLILKEKAEKKELVFSPLARELFIFLLLLYSKKMKENKANKYFLVFIGPKARIIAKNLATNPFYDINTDLGRLVLLQNFFMQKNAPLSFKICLNNKLCLESKSLDFS